MQTIAANRSIFGEHVRESTTWSIVLSVLMMISGVFAIAVPPAAGLAVTAIVGWLLILTGAAHLGFAWRANGAAAIFGEIGLAVLYGALGVYILARPVAGLASLTLAVAIYFAARGILEGAVALTLRPLPGSGWLLFDGILTIAIAVMIAAAWPASTAWAIGTLVGIGMISSGFTRLMVSVAVRKVFA